MDRESRVVKKRSVTSQAALLKLMRLCSLSEKSSADAKRLLLKWEISPNDSTEIIEKLLADKYIDDNRYMQLYIKEKMVYNGWGVRKIASSLAVKGLPRDKIERAIAMADTSKQKQKLDEVLARKYKSIKDKESDRYKLKDKLFRFAASRGYDFDEILSAVERMLKS